MTTTFDELKLLAVQKKLDEEAAKLKSESGAKAQAESDAINRLKKGLDTAITPLIAKELQLEYAYKNSQARAILTYRGVPIVVTAAASENYFDVRLAATGGMFTASGDELVNILLVDVCHKIDTLTAVIDVTVTFTFAVEAVSHDQAINLARQALDHLNPKRLSISTRPSTDSLLVEAGN